MSKKITKKQALIDASIAILAKYKVKITLRQLFYRLVTSRVIKNEQKEYKRLVMAMSDARVKSKQIPFDAFVDEDREFNGWHPRYETKSEGMYDDAEEVFETAEDTFKGTANKFNLPAWHGQATYVEVWCEKKALNNVFLPVCKKNSVVYGAAKGMPSLSWLYEASERFKSMIRRQNGIEKYVILVYSDFDPAGIDIHKNIKKHINITFQLPQVEVIRMAIDQTQIAKYNILPMPTKPTDSRYKKWVAQYGDVSCVELDAIEVDDLTEIIRTDIHSHFDFDTGEERKELIKEGRELIQEKIDEYFEEEDE